MGHAQLLRLQRIEVDGLFGIYDHHIDLNLAERVTLLHGPNGVGKTSVLRMVDAALRNDLAYFRRIPFARFLLQFHDDSTLELHRPSTFSAMEGPATLKLTNADGTIHHGSIDLHPSAAESIAMRIPYLQPHYSLPGNWIDVRDGTVLSDPELVSQFGTKPDPTVNGLALSLTLSHPLYGVDPVPADTSPWLDDFLETTHAFLIDAQRLVRARSPATSPMRLFPGPPTFVSSVLECSLDFRDRLGRTMAAYGRQAQTLDQTFPQRLVSATNQLAPEELRGRMMALDRKTSELRAMGILDDTHPPPFDAASLDRMEPSQGLVMTLYVEDTERKLQALEDLTDRIRLLLNSVNGKFRNKQVHLGADGGLVTRIHGGAPLPLHALSSGEQHELVLHYDLLFRVRPNTVVLIDEPELSLHVGWQKRFLPDLVEIVQLSGFDAIVATHSPFIVGDRDDLLVPLGD